MMRYILISVLLAVAMPYALQAQEEDKTGLVAQIHQKIKDKQDKKREIKKEKKNKIKQEKTEQTKQDEEEFINGYDPFDPLTAYSRHAGTISKHAETTQTDSEQKVPLEDQGHPQNHPPRLNAKVNRVHENLRW